MQAKVEILEKDETKVHQWGVYNVYDSNKYEWDRYPVEIVNNHIWELRKVDTPVVDTRSLIKVDYSNPGLEQELAYVHFKRCKPYTVNVELSSFNYETSTWADIPYASIPFDKFFARIKYDDNLDTVMSREWLEENATSLIPWDNTYNNYEWSLTYKYKETAGILGNYQTPLKMVYLNKDNIWKTYNRYTVEGINTSWNYNQHQSVPELYITNHKRYQLPQFVWEDDDYVKENMFEDQASTYPYGIAPYFEGFDYHFSFSQTQLNESTIASRIAAEIRKLQNNKDQIPMIQRLKGLTAYGWGEQGPAWVRDEDSNSYTIDENNNAFWEELVPFGYSGGELHFLYDRNDITTSGTFSNATIDVVLHMEVPIITLSCTDVIYGRYDGYTGAKYASLTSLLAYGGSNIYTKQIDYWDSLNYAINIYDYEITREADGGYGPVYGYLTNGISRIYEAGEEIPFHYVGNRSNSRYIGVVYPGDLIPILYDNVYDWGREFCMDWTPTIPEGKEIEVMEIESTIENYLNDNQVIFYKWDDGIYYSSLVDYVGIKKTSGNIIGDPVRVFSYNHSAYPLSTEGELYNGYLYKYVGSTTVQQTGSLITRVTSINPAAYPWNGSLITGGSRRWYVYEGLKRTVLRTFYPAVLLDCTLQQSIGNSNSFSIGCVGGASAQFEILKPIPDLIQYKGYDCFIYFSYPHPIFQGVRGYYKEGLFTIRELEENGFNRTIVTAYDNVYKLDCKAWPLISRLPADTDLLRLFYYICAYCDIPYASEFFFTNNDMVLGDISTWSRDVTCRDIITWIAQVSGNVMVCDENGVLVVKELEQPVLTRGSGTSENRSLQVGMVPVIKPEAIRYKIGSSNFTIGEEYTQWENRILDYTSNGLISNKTQLENDRRLEVLLNKIQQIEDIYSFECDVDNNIYECACGDSWIVEGENIEPRRGIITDRRIGMDGIHLTSSAGIEAEYVPMAVSNIDGVIDTLDSSVFRKIHIENIYFKDKYTGNIYNTIVADYDFSITNTSFSYDNITIDIGSQFDNLFTYPSQKVEIYIGINKAQVWIENHNLYVIESAHTSELFDSVNDIVVYYGNFNYYNYPALSHSYKFSEKYEDEWDVLKTEIVNDYEVPIDCTLSWTQRVDDESSKHLNTSINLGGFKLKEILEYLYNNGSGKKLTFVMRITEEEGLTYYTSWNDNNNESHELVFTLSDDENYPGSFDLSYDSTNKKMIISYFPNTRRLHDNSDGVYIESNPLDMTYHVMDGIDSIVLLKIGDGPLQEVHFDKTNYGRVRACPSKFPDYSDLGGYHNFYGRGHDVNVLPIYTNNTYRGSICFHVQGQYDDRHISSWTFKGSTQILPGTILPGGTIVQEDSPLINYNNTTVTNLKYQDYGSARRYYPNPDDWVYWDYDETSPWGKAAKEWTLAHDSEATDDNYKDSSVFLRISALFTFDSFDYLPIVTAVVFDEYTNYEIDTLHGNVGLYINNNYFVPQGMFELDISDQMNKIYIHYAPTKTLIAQAAYINGAFYESHPISGFVDVGWHDARTGVLHMDRIYSSLDELLGIERGI